MANASHELKTPIARIISTIDALDEEKIRLNPDIKNIREQLFSMAETIEDLLLLAKIREYKPKEGFCYVAKVIENIIEDNKKQLLEKNITISNFIYSDLVFPVPQIYARIILSNLIGNAIKFSDKNSKIIIASEINSLKRSVSITNYGPTISEEDKKRIFDRFYRTNKSKGGDGIGIGLAIVKSLCDMYSIDISVTSQNLENSTTFALRWNKES